MSKSNRYLSGLLLLLIGILVGGVVVLFQHGYFINDHSNVKITHIKRSEKPIFGDDELQKIDSRFLFKKVAAHVTPSVVYITSIVSLDDQGDPEEQNFWQRFHARHARTVGSGVIVAKNGYIVTNNHVIKGAVDNGIEVILHNKRVYKARVVGSDPTTDLAILKVDAKNLPAITVGNSDSVNVGEWVLAIGNPFRLRSTVTAGIVSALSRQVQISGESNSRLHIDSFIQTDAAINKGNSGGALVSTSGDLIGINTAIATKSGSYQGYGFAIPANLVSKVMTDLIQYGSVHRALLGVSISSVDDARAKDLGMDEIRGVEIMEVTKDGAARKAGLHKDDVILAVNGQPVDESNQLQEKIAIKQPGDTVHLTILRDGKALHKKVILGKVDPSENYASASQKELPPPSASKHSKNHEGVAFGNFPSFGFKVMALATRKDPHKFDLFVARVYSSTPAGQSDLKKGDIIRRINGQPLATIKELQKKMQSTEDSLNLEIETQAGNTKKIHIQK